MNGKIQGFFFSFYLTWTRRALRLYLVLDIYQSLQEDSIFYFYLNYIY